MMNDELYVVHLPASGLDGHKGHITATVRLAAPPADEPGFETRMFNDPAEPAKRVGVPPPHRVAVLRKHRGQHPDDDARQRSQDSRIGGSFDDGSAPSSRSGRPAEQHRRADAPTGEFEARVVEQAVDRGETLGEGSSAESVGRTEGW